MSIVIPIVFVGAAVAGFVQGLSGFAFGLVAISFWAWVVDPKLAAAMAVFGALIGQVISAVTIRRGFDLKQLLPFVLGGLVGVPIGVAILPLLDPNLFKAVLGTLLLVWCPCMLVSRHLPRVTRGGPAADGASGLIGGIFGGIAGVTGVIPTLWCTLRGMAKDEQRSIIQNFNLIMLAVAMAAYVLTGAVTSDMLPMFALIAPAILIMAWLGGKVYIGLSEATFRKVVLTCLTASGIGLLATSLPVLLR